MNHLIRTISESLTSAPLLALKTYEQGLGSPDPIPDILRRRYGDAMGMIRAGRDIGSKEQLDALSQLHASARRADRRRLVAAAVDQIVALGLVADVNSQAPERVTLEQIGATFPKLVLEGPLHQQLACKLATRLGFPRPVPVPKTVCELVAVPMIRALIVVLRLGAPTTRDAAVEGLGALLKLVDDDPAQFFPADSPLPVRQQTDESNDEYAARVRISDEYLRRLERRRLMVLTIAGHEPSSTIFCKQLETSTATALQKLFAAKPTPWNAIEDVLYERPDLLRILPAVARQRLDLPADPTVLLCDAARLTSIDEDAPPSVLIAFARFQESVFRTIDTAIRRDWNLNDFDDVVAAAVSAIPPAMAASPAVCNAQIRTTVAILRTAISLVVKAGPSESETKKALVPLFADLDARKPWTNLGIAEGCFRGLPDLIPSAAHDDLTGPALEALFKQLERAHAVDDLIETHRHLIANACFRRLLVALTDGGHERHLQLTSEAAAQWDELKVQRHVRILLREPTPENVRSICRLEHDVGGEADAVRPANVAQIVVAGVAFESELLHRIASMFQQWNGLGTAQKLLLTRILAAQLHAISRDTPELRRHAILRRAFAGMLAVSIADDEAMNAVWELLSSLPAEAAEAADVEIQRFVAYRPPAEHGHDLPGYVLAMISPDASGRIAGAIAREIDLKLRHEAAHGELPDIARALHQVMLRGPHESIFDHLLPRICNAEDQAIVLLFRKHVASVLHSPTFDDGSFDRKHILAHVRKLQEDLSKQTSETLKTLHKALDHYEELTADLPSVWQSIETGKAIGLMEVLDVLAHGEDHHRKQLCETFKPRLVLLQEDVAHYVALPVQNYAARAEALQKAYGVAADIEASLGTHPGLQPPERSLLIALMQHFRALFDGTRHWYCDEARRRNDAGDKEHFWLFFCDPRGGDERIAALRELVRRGPERAQQLLSRLADEAQINRLVDLIGREPPHFRGQRAKFEEYFVEWMASDLDVQSLKRVLRDRWSWWFRLIYGIVTNFWLTSALILLPCSIAVVADLFGKHHWEGVGFCAVTLAIVFAAWLSLTQVLHALARWLRRGKTKARKPGYWFPCLLPRLARLTAVPMALIVEFDHSYDFPMNGTTPVLLLLMVISFVTTRFFVAREIVDRKERPGIVHLTREERKRVRQIVAVALAHSFGIAVLLSAIFAPSHRHEPSIPKPKHATVAPGQPHRVWSGLQAVLQRLDDTSPSHPHRRLVGLLPREVTLDLGAIAEENKYPLPRIVAEHASFSFYPTIILTWTALGLFFGVFLEGFMKGERLRGAWPGKM